MFKSDAFWVSLCTSIFGNSNSAANNTRTRLPSRLSFHFLWLCCDPLLLFQVFKGATNLNFMRYLCVVIILFNTDLYESAFPSYSFKNLALRFSVFCIFCLFYFELDVIYNICLMKVGLSPSKKTVLFASMKVL